MMTCETFRAGFAPATEDAALLTHVRSCDACLDYAAEVDPDIIFRAIGGAEMIPPGGVDAFVGDVMREVRLRSTEQAIAPARVLSWPQRFAIAATIAAGLTGALLVVQHEQTTTTTPVARIAAPKPIAPAVAAISRPVIENYESENATLVEVPADASDVKIVMVFDENLPADL